ncbi:MAG: hypothetical protein IPN97_16300 [Saprospiraceae bacterium]|nr:hypothetical protein [Saprospiraceae bacterium]
MPFKVNGQYYFEHIEIFKSDFIGQEVEFPYLALCPNCAAKYKFLVKSDDKKLLDIKNSIIEMTEDEQQIIYIGLEDERIELFFYRGTYI